MGSTARIRAGRVVLICRACETRGEDAAPVVTAIEPVVLSSRMDRRVVASVPVGAALMGVVLLLATGGFATGLHAPPTSVARAADRVTRAEASPALALDLDRDRESDLDLESDLDRDLGDETGAADDDDSDDDASGIAFDVDGVLERYPSLRSWVHPVMGAPVMVPLKSSRKFGAARDGERPSECGRGHCGIDLGGPVGTPVFAVAWGEVVRIERRADRRSGRYVKLRHPEGEQTAYMHLDEIAEDLRMGDEIEAGQMIGTLGRTGINDALPHLHFSLTLPDENSRNPEAVIHIDPVPFLRDAAVLDQRP